MYGRKSERPSAAYKAPAANVAFQSSAAPEPYGLLALADAQAGLRVLANWKMPINILIGYVVVIHLGRSMVISAPRVRHDSHRMALARCHIDGTQAAATMSGTQASKIAHIDRDIGGLDVMT